MRSDDQRLAIAAWCTEAGRHVDSSGDDSTGPSARRLSYKFQRLRERIRAAIDAGELAGKLPGERSLARQFNVNAKTLSKALTDLAAEGLLERNIGLGTFVRDASASPAVLRILLLTEGGTGGPLADTLRRHGVDPQVHSPDGDLPPSLLAPFDIVLIDSDHVSQDAVRNLVVRGKTVVLVDRMPRPFSTHALLPNTHAAAMLAAMELVTLGHKRVLLIPDDVSGPADIAVARAVPTAEVRPVALSELTAAARDGFTAAVVPGHCAVRALADCRTAGLDVPNHFSVLGYGRVAEPETCGHFVTDAMVAAALADLLTGGLPHKPVTLWLAAEKVSRGTLAAAPSALAANQPDDQ